MSSNFNKNWNFSTDFSEAHIYKISRWKNDVENDVIKMGVVNWSQVVQDRDGMTRASGGWGALIVLGYWSRRGRNM
jgi:hypothetical protein